MSNSVNGYPIHKKKLCDYYHQFTYNDIDYDAAYAYYLENADIPASACSAFRIGRFFARNLDLAYSEDVEFLIRTPKTANSYAVNGHAGGFHDLSETFVSSGEESELYKILPFQLHDGVNNVGLAACYNLVPTDYGQNVAVPTGTQEVEICALMLVRFILDRFDSAYEAAKYIQEHCKVYFTAPLHQSSYELHLMIADTHSTYIVEFINNATEIIDVTDTPYMTNFHRYDTVLNDDGTVFTPETQTDDDDAITTNGITEYGSGLERFNLIANAISTCEEDRQACAAILRRLRYSRAYPGSTYQTIPQWYTEFVGDGRKVNTPVSGYASAMEAAEQAYAERSRSNPVTWHTTHSVIYDMFSAEMYVIPQEGSEAFSPEMIPFGPSSRLEAYLGEMAGLYGYERPSAPSSRLEAYLEYMIQNGTQYGLAATVVGNKLILSAPISDVVVDLNTEV